MLGIILPYDFNTNPRVEGESKNENKIAINVYFFIQNKDERSQKYRKTFSL